MRFLAGTVLLMLGAGLVLVSTRNLLAHNYAAQATSLSRWTPDHPAAIAATRQASRWAPWNPGPHKALAWKLASRQRAEARRQMQTALLWAPADAYVWNDYARLLIRQRRFNKDTESAAALALKLAPNSDAVHASHAWMAIHYWAWASADLQKLWLPSLRREWRQNRDRVIREVLNGRRVRLFCLGAGAQLAAAQSWCAATPWESPK